MTPNKFVQACIAFDPAAAKRLLQDCLGIEDADADRCDFPSLNEWHRMSDHLRLRAISKWIEHCIIDTDNWMHTPVEGARCPMESVGTND